MALKNTLVIYPVSISHHNTELDHLDQDLCFNYFFSAYLCLISHHFSYFVVRQCSKLLNRSLKITDDLILIKILILI